MRRSAFYFRAPLRSSRAYSSQSQTQYSFFQKLRRQLTSVESWKGAWRYLLWFPAIIFIDDHVVSISRVNGISMRPTLNPDTNFGKRDLVVLYKFRFEPQRGDIVVLKSPQNPKSWVIKRIIATEGDIVETRPTYPERNVVVPHNHFWVEGDEAFHSKDSNTYGPVTKLLVVGKVEYVLWPRPRIVRHNGFTHDRVIFGPPIPGIKAADDRADIT